ncbi:uncharacterized protein LOC125761052 isoform X2 [Anopheles funestus]|uniref:uncharacterized protein LOC125761052 isoform X2 n=1 Tax=Anopheles funestus TaxID=62324 RepID=UPI0020C709FA|nr:uncharacterized protein LOC125761052 isoform X2 [Anopheles funestus]
MDLQSSLRTALRRILGEDDTYGTSSGVKPLIPFDDSSATLLNTWRTSQVYTNMLWKKWLKSYLPTLTKRTKWFEPCRPVAIGDLVLVVDENHPRNCWPRGRVVEVVQSRDGTVRRVTIQTAKGTRLERPVVKVVVLDVGHVNSTTAMEPSHGAECQQ